MTVVAMNALIARWIPNAFQRLSDCKVMALQAIARGDKRAVAPPGARVTPTP